MEVPLPLLAVSLLTLFAFLALLLGAVDVGVAGDVPLSNDLAVGALAAMTIFAVVNLTQQSAMARSTRPT